MSKTNEKHPHAEEPNHSAWKRTEMQSGRPEFGS